MPSGAPIFVHCEVSDDSRLPAILLDGYRAFLVGRFARESQCFSNRAKTGQQPKVIAIG
jgi:hypothetical protein